MEIINSITGIFGSLGLDAIADAVNGVTALINGLIPAEVPFIEQLEGFFGNMSNVFNNLADLKFDFAGLEDVIASVSKLFGA